MKIIFLKKLDQAIGPILSRCFPSVQKEKSLSAFSRILMIRPGGIGDAVLLCPVVSLLQSIVPESSIEILAESRNSKVFTLCPEIKKVYRYDQPTELLACLKKNYDIVIDTEQWHRLSAIVARLVKAELRIGFSSKERARLFHHAVAYMQSDYELANFLRLVDVLGCSMQKVKMPYLHVPETDRQRAEVLAPAELLSGFVTIFPGASIPERRWNPSNFARLVGLFKERNLPIVVVGGSEDRETGEKIVADGWGINFAGKTSLAETAAIIDRSDLLVSGDSGVLHIGVGLGKSTVSLFGPGIAQKWAPRGENHIVLNKNLPCSPCTKFGYTPKCPIEAKCLSDISVDEVFAAAMTLLKRNQPMAIN